MLDVDYGVSTNVHVFAPASCDDVFMPKEAVFDSFC